MWLLDSRPGEPGTTAFLLDGKVTHREEEGDVQCSISLIPTHLATYLLENGKFSSVTFWPVNYSARQSFIDYIHQQMLDAARAQAQWKKNHTFPYEMVIKSISSELPIICMWNVI